MFKKLVLIVLIGINNTQASDAPKTDFIQKIKNSSGTVKVVAGIIPCIVTFISMEAVIRTNKDNPKLHNILNIAYYIKWISLIIATIFCDWLFKIDFKKWLLSCPKKDASIATGDSHTP